MIDVCHNTEDLRNHSSVIDSSNERLTVGANPKMLNLEGCCHAKAESDC